METHKPLIRRPSMGEGAARFWTAVWGGITAVSLIAAGWIALVQYLESKNRDVENQKHDHYTLVAQITATRLAAKKGFNDKHLELCVQAAGDAGTIATSKEKSKKHEAEEDFWRLYWGPLGIVEGGKVASAMVAFGKYLNALTAGQTVQSAPNPKEAGQPMPSAPSPKTGSQKKENGSNPQSLAYNLALACRNEISCDFELSLPKLPPRPEDQTADTAAQPATLECPTPQF